MSSTKETAMVGIERHLPLPQRPGHHVQVVELISRWRRDGVVTARHEHALAVADRKALVERAVGGVDPLYREPSLVAESVVVRLLERGLAGRVVRVVLVRRVAGPMSAR